MKRVRWTTEWIWLAALTLAVSMHFWFPNLRPGLNHDSYDVSEEGKKAFYLTMRLEGQKDDRRIHVQRTFRPLADIVAGERASVQNRNLAAPTVLCLLGPERDPSSTEWDSMLNWVHRGGALVVAARHTRPELSVPGLNIEVLPVGDAGDADRYSDESGKIRTKLITHGDLYWSSRGFVKADRADRLIEFDGLLQAVVQQHGRGRVVVIASDFIFSNQSIAWEDNPELAFALLNALPADAANLLDRRRIASVYIDESLNATGTPKVVGLLLQPPFRMLTIQLLVVVVVFGWWRSRRFGPLLPQAVAARQDVVDHTDAVGTHAWKARDGAAMLQAYQQQLSTELHMHVHKGQEDRVLEPIARRLNRPVEAVRRVFTQSERAGASKRLDRKTAAELIRRLSHIRRAAQRGRKSASDSD